MGVAETQVSAVTLSANEETLVMGSMDHKVRIYHNSGRNRTYDHQAWCLVREFDDAKGDITAVALSKDAGTLVTASSDSNARIYVSSKGIWHLDQTLDDAQSKLLTVALSTNAKIIATGSAGMTRVYACADYNDVNDVDGPCWNLTQTLDHAADAITAVTLSADTNMLVSASLDSKTRIYFASEPDDLGLDTHIRHFALSRILEAGGGCDEPAVEVEAVDDTLSVSTIAGGDEPRVRAVTVNGDATTLVTGLSIPRGFAEFHNICNGEGKGMVNIYNRLGAADWQRVQVLPHMGAVRAVTLSADGKTLASGSNDVNVRIFQWTRISNRVSRWELTQTLCEVNEPIERMSTILSADASTLIIGCFDSAWIYHKAGLDATVRVKQSVAVAPPVRHQAM